MNRALELMGLIIVMLLLSLAHANVETSITSASSEPEALVKNLTQKLLGVTSKKQKTEENSLKEVVELIDAQLLPHVNRNQIVKKVLANHWSTTEAPLRADFSAAFEQSLVLFLAKNLVQYKDLSIDFKETKLSKSGNAALVMTSVGSGAQATPLSLVYLLRKEGADTWLVEDFIIDGVSFITSKQQEFARPLAQAGVAKLTADLRAVNAKTR